MSFPCIDTDYFYTADGLAPFLDLQERHVATTSAVSWEQTLAPKGAAKNILYQTLDVKFENASPLSQQAFCMITRGGSQVVLTARSRATLSLSANLSMAPFPGTAPPPGGSVVSRSGVGADTGLQGIQTDFAVVEDRQGQHTFQIGEVFVVPPMNVFWIAMELRFVSDNWENGTINGGDAETEAKVLTGATRMDIFATPIIPA